MIQARDAMEKHGGGQAWLLCSASRPAFLRRLLSASALLLAASGATAAADLAPLFPICSEGRTDFSTRIAAIEALGYRKLGGDNLLWLQGQLSHIAMSDLEFQDSVNPDVYRSFREMADAGELFRTDTQTQLFGNQGGDVVFELALVDGAISCSFAFGGETAIPLPIVQSWSSEAGSYTVYRASSGTAAGSNLSAVWDGWIDEPRQAAGFFLIGQ